MKRSVLSQVLWTASVILFSVLAGWYVYELSKETIAAAPTVARAFMAILLACPLFVVLWALCGVVIVDAECLNYTHGRYWLSFARTVLWLAFSFGAALLLIIAINYFL